MYKIEWKTYRKITATLLFHIMCVWGAKQMTSSSKFKLRPFFVANTNTQYSSDFCLNSFVKNCTMSDLKKTTKLSLPLLFYGQNRHQNTWFWPFRHFSDNHLLAPAVFLPSDYKIPTCSGDQSTCRISKWPSMLFCC